MSRSDSERFARAVEGERDLPTLDGSLRRTLSVVTALRAAGRSAGPDQAARARMRARVLTGVAEVVDAVEIVDLVEPVEPVRVVRRTGPAERVERVAVIRSRRTGIAGFRGRVIVASAAALCLLLSLSGMSLLLARDALPGDALYGVKRTAESAELGLTFGAEARGFKHLQFATARVDEIEALTARASGIGGAGGARAGGADSTGHTDRADDADVYLTALSAFDTDAAAGSRLLIEAGTNGDGTLLAALHDWSGQQRRRIDTATDGLAAAVGSRATGSMALLTRVAERTMQLRARLACLTVTSGATDEVGPMPAAGTCEPASGEPTGAGERTTEGTGRGPDVPGRRPGSPDPGESADPEPDDPAEQPDDRPRSTTDPLEPPLLPVPDPGLPLDPNQPTLTIPLPIGGQIAVPPLAPGLPGLIIGLLR